MFAFKFENLLILSGRNWLVISPLPQFAVDRRRTHPQYCGGMRHIAIAILDGPFDVRPFNLPHW